MKTNHLIFACFLNLFCTFSAAAQVKFDAVNWNERYCYFFKGSQYYNYNIAKDAVETGYPKPIQGNWAGVTFDQIDAAVNWGNGYAYFFRGSQYIKYNIAQDKAEAGYPKPIQGNWTGLFTSDIDAAVNWGNGFAYFFKGSQYVKYDIAQDKVVAGYPRPIQGNWNGLTFNRIDAALSWSNGKVYLFSGDSYVRFDKATDKVPVEAGYPRQISDGWKGVGQAAPVNPPADLATLLNTPAKDLTIGQAIEVVLDYENKNPGAILLASHQNVGTLQKYITDLNNSNQYNAKTNKVAKKFIYLNPTLKGVTFKVNQMGTKKSPISNVGYLYVDPRNAVAILRLCEFSASKGVTEIHHCGINADASRTDNHGEGRAVDLVGVRLSGALVYVKEDWYDQKVPVLDGNGNPTGALSNTNLWPNKTFSKLYFRLNYSNNPNLDVAKNYFNDLYQFLNVQYKGSANPEIGEYGAIMHPDHPTAAPGTKNGREAHNAHIHFNIGPTGSE